MTTPAFEPVELPSKYSKAIVAILTAVVTAVVAALGGDGLVTPVEAAQVAIALVTAVGVYAVPNLPAGALAYAKMGVAVGGTVLQALVSVLMQGALTPQGLLTILVAALGAVSVGIVPNVDAVPLAEVEYDPKYDVES